MTIFNAYNEFTGARSKAVLSEVWHERIRQDERWGEQNHPDLDPRLPRHVPLRDFAAFARHWKAANEYAVSQGAESWDGILLEEVYEALSEEDPAKLRAELIQVAAVAVAWVEAIDRRSA
ncbi:hypothetical protein [Actinophytocola sp. NPDC049390]|uniref:hypothetical protein n=1 Tax=Actinophytocola sp. NPDC049390 TaxID=3363894 RepID=UPI00378E7B20